LDNPEFILLRQQLVITLASAAIPSHLAEVPVASPSSSMLPNPARKISINSDGKMEQI
jgi:Tfp pilus assembly protein FimV